MNQIETNTVDAEDDMLDEGNLQLMDDSEASSDHELDFSESDPSLVASIGCSWNRHGQRVGRLSSQNAFVGRRGFRVGMHPENRSEALQIFFGLHRHSYYLHYYIIQGRQIVHQSNIL